MADKCFDVIVVGGGPSGLLATLYLVKKRRDVLLVEKGKILIDRDKENAKDIACGIGGAGLYSDGKVSFYPSASKLWNLKSKETLKSRTPN